MEGVILHRQYLSPTNDSPNLTSLSRPACLLCIFFLVFTKFMIRVNQMKMLHQAKNDHSRFYKG